MTILSNVDMKEDIKRTMFVFCGLFILYFYTRTSIFTLLQYFDGSSNSMMIASYIWMTILILIPTIYILKISPLKVNIELENKITKFEISIIILLCWALYRIIVYSSMQISLIHKIIAQSNNITTVYEHSSIIIRSLLFLFSLVIEELIFRGMLLNKLRSYGDIFAVVVSSVVFALIHYTTFFVVIFAGLLLGMVYVISNSISSAIILHALVNLGAVFLEELVLKNNYNNIFLLYATIFVVCLAIMLIDKRFKLTFIALKKIYKEEASHNKGKYSAAFKSEGFLTFAIIMGLNSALGLALIFK